MAATVSLRHALLLALLAIGTTVLSSSHAVVAEQNTQQDAFSLRGTVHLGGTKVAVRPEHVRVVLSLGGGKGREEAFLMNDGSFEINDLEEGTWTRRLGKEASSEFVERKKPRARLWFWTEKSHRVSCL